MTSTAPSQPGNPGQPGNPSQPGELSRPTPAGRPSPPEPLPGARLLFSLDPAVSYLNHGMSGVVPIPVQRAQQRFRDEMEANPQRFFSRGLHDRITHARGHLAAFLGADP